MREDEGQRKGWDVPSEPPARGQVLWVMDPSCSLLHLSSVWGDEAAGAWTPAHWDTFNDSRGGKSDQGSVPEQLLWGSNLEPKQNLFRICHFELNCLTTDEFTCFSLNPRDYFIIGAKKKKKDKTTAGDSSSRFFKANLPRTKSFGAKVHAGRRNAD